MGVFVDLTGQVFGRLTVIERAPGGGGAGRSIRWACRCECGEETTALRSNLKSGRTSSCGCGEGGPRHGLSASLEYSSWCAMKSRCLNPKTEGYEYYGGRGVTICERWISSFEAFYADMGPRPSMKYSIDRIDCDGPYEPGNCRWATRSEQASNQRRHVRALLTG